MSPFSRVGPVCRAEINHLEISALLKNTTKNQNLSYEKKSARSTEILLFSTEIPAKRAEFFSYDNSMEVDLHNKCREPRFANANPGLRAVNLGLRC